MYFNYSGAERKAIDLAVMFAFIDMLKMQTNVYYNVQFYDELLDVFRILLKKLDTSPNNMFFLFQKLHNFTTLSYHSAQILLAKTHCTQLYKQKSFHQQ